MKNNSKYKNMDTKTLYSTFKKGDVIFTREYNVWSVFDLLHSNEGVFHNGLIIEKNNQLYILHSHCASRFNPQYVLYEYTYFRGTWHVLEEPLLDYIHANNKSVYHIFRHNIPKNLIITKEMIQKANYYCSHLIGTIFYDNKLFTDYEKGGSIIPFYPDKIIPRLYQLGYKSLFVRHV